MTNEAQQHLQALGFSEYEGKAYVALLQQGPLSGYQLAKASRIPRPNIYPVLDRLHERGAVVRVQVKGGVKYSALPAEEMLSRLFGNVEAHLTEARRALSEMETAPAPEYVWNIQGYDGTLAKARALVAGARKRLLAGVWSTESRLLSEALAEAQARGVEVTVLCIQGCPEECGGCRGQVYRYPLAGDAETRWLVLAADDEEMLVGQIFPDGGATGVVSRLESLVSVGTHYLRNSIAAAEIVRSLGSRLPELVDAPALEALRGAGLATAGRSWLERTLSAVSGSQRG